MEQGPVEIFIDASVLFAVSDSPKGASREIIRYALRGRIRLVVNRLVLDEVEGNLRDKRPAALPMLQILRAVISFRIVNPTKSEVLKMQPYTALKDAPHFAAALKAKVYCIVSLDRKHMIAVRDKVQEELGLRVLLPSELLEEIRSKS